jgi:outer membrane protein OmpA-like peptidoglycan-associated protein
MAHFQLRITGRFACALAVLVCLAGGALAQSSTWKKAQRLYDEQGDYEGAMELFKKDLEKKPNAESTVGMANCYRKLGSRTEATEWYNKALEFKNYDPTVHLYLAEVLMQDSRYEEAKSHLLEYKKSPYASPIAVQRLVATCDSGIYWVEEAMPGVLKNESALNSPGNDWGTNLYGSAGISFCSDRDSLSINSPYEEDAFKLQRVLMAEFDGEGWKSIRAFERPVNGANFNAGPIVFLKDPNYFIVARSSGNPDLPRMAVKTFNNTGMYYIRMMDGALNVVPFDYNSVVQYSMDGPCLSADEQTLYFSSNKPGGYGGFDLYYCKRLADGTWDEPQSCGAGINTPGDEVYPTLSADGTLYFASSGHIGMGGLDIFYAKGKEGSFGKPVNMGYPINSGANDFSLLPLSSGKVLFSSNRGGGLGGSDIYSFTYDFTKLRPRRTIRPAAPPVVTVAEAAPAKEEPKAEEVKEEPKPAEEPAKEEPKKEEPAAAAPAAVAQAAPVEPEDFEIVIEEKPKEKKKEEPKKEAAEEPQKEEPKVAEEKPAEAPAKEEPKVAQPQPAAPVAEPVAEEKPAPAPQPAPTPQPAPAPVAAVPAETTPADEFNIRIETVDRDKAALGSANIRLVDNATNRSTRLRTDNSGGITVNVALGASYTLTASKDGYAPASIRFVIPSADKKVVARLTLESLTLNRDMRLTGLYYDNKRWNLKAGGEKELDKLVKLLNDNPRMQIELKSYSSDNNKFSLDQQLAAKRARNILNYLAFKGIEEERIYALGYAFKGSSEEGNTYRTMYRLFKEGERDTDAAEVKRKAAADQRAKQQAARLQQQKKAAEARRQQQAAAAKQRTEATAAARAAQQQKLQQQRAQQQQQAQLRRQATAQRAAAARARQAKRTPPPQPFESFEIKTVD